MATAVTYDEWLRMPEVQDATEEVIDGEIRITPPAQWAHAWTVSNIRRALVQLDEPEFLVATAQFGLVIRKAPLTVRVPDLAVFEIGTIVEQDGFIHSPPSSSPKCSHRAKISAGNSQTTPAWECPKSGLFHRKRRRSRR
jgi:Uma2 family endonuclease